MRGSTRWERRPLLILLTLALLAAACSGDDGGEQGGTDGGSDDGGEQGGDDDGDGSTGSTAGGVRRGETGAVTVRLSEGEATVGVAQLAVATVGGDPIDQAAIDAVLARLPEWVDDDSYKTDFNRPAETLPPPRVGNTIDVSFPADPGGDPPPEIEEGPLEVLRVQPTGPVGIAPFVSLTFNQPMVPLATLEQLEAEDIPVTMTPELPGRWQWIGTRTLRFEHDVEIFDRLPQSTSYVVEVPASTTSESGGVLAEAVRFEFETPTPSVVWLTPQHDSLDLEPVFLATFDQRIDLESVLATISLEADGQAREIRFATDNEIMGDEDTQQRVDSALAGTWIAFRAAEAFAPDQAISIRVGPNVPSAEGPNTSSGVERFGARTYAPLRIEGQSCESPDQCRPGRSIEVWFNNILDPASLDAADVGIEPELAGTRRISVQGSQVSIRGNTLGGTEYEVTIPGGLTDAFGQTLGNNETLTFRFDNSRPQIRQLDRVIATVDPLAEGQSIPVAVMNHDQLRVRLFEVAPENWGGYLAYLETWQRRFDEPLPTPPWVESYDRVIDTDSVEDVLTEVRVDVEPVLGGDPGHVVMIVEGVGRFAALNPQSQDFWDNRPVVTWAQATSLGVDMVITNEPGIYIPEEALGVRIENDFLITAEGAENLSVGLPVAADDKKILGFAEVI